MNVFYMSVVFVKWKGTEGTLKRLPHILHEVPDQQDHSTYPRAAIAFGL